MQVWGYVPDGDRDAAWATVELHRALLSGVSFFQFHIHEDGEIVEYPGLGREPDGVAETGLPIVPMVTNLIGGDWNRDLVALVLANPAARSRHLENLLALVVDGGYPGLELDYENLSGEDRGSLSQFVLDLGDALHARGQQLSLALHAKLSEPGDWGGAQAQDWAALGRAADRLVIMTYDHDPSRPGPIAPIAWTESVLEFALSQIPAAKVIQGIPFYGYDWAADGERAYRTYQELEALAAAYGVRPKREVADHHLVMGYSRNGVDHEVWIPDSVTVEKLLAVGQRLGVSGYAIWRMGGEDPAVWEVIVRMAGVYSR